MVEMIVLNCTGVDNLEFIEWSRIILSKEHGVNKKKIPLFEISDFFDKRQKEKSIVSFEKYGYYVSEFLFNKGLPGKIGTQDDNRLRYIDQVKLIEVEKLISLSKEFNIKGKDLAKKLGTDPTTISNLINKKVHNISLDFIVEKGSILMNPNYCLKNKCQNS